MQLNLILTALLASIGVIGGADGPTVFTFGGFNMDTVWQALEIMGKGMLGIFVVMILIALIVVLMNRLGSPKK